tara:strand:+ start:170 stop:469 length:300 start_codon:yes stop_codon:yes gene_type:complete
MKSPYHNLNISDIKKGPFHNNGLFHAFMLYRLVKNKKPQIMTNKLKSLIYLACFICASVVYHQNTNTEVQKEIATNSYEQDADIIINPYKNLESINQTN